MSRKIGFASVAIGMITIVGVIVGIILSNQTVQRPQDTRVVVTVPQTAPAKLTEPPKPQVKPQPQPAQQTPHQWCMIHQPKIADCGTAGNPAPGQKNAPVLPGTNPPSSTPTTTATPPAPANGSVCSLGAGIGKVIGGRCTPFVVGRVRGWTVGSVGTCGQTFYSDGEATLDC